MEVCIEYVLCITKFAVYFTLYIFYAVHSVVKLTMINRQQNKNHQQKYHFWSLGWLVFSCFYFLVLPGS